MRQSQNKLPGRACAPRGGLAVAAVTASIAAQPASVPLVDANFASFVEHPTHCASLLDGRAGIVLDAKSCSKKQDDVATLAYRSLLAGAGNDHVRGPLIASLMRTCAAKRK